MVRWKMDYFFIQLYFPGDFTGFQISPKIARNLTNALFYSLECTHAFTVIYDISGHVPK